MNTLDFDGVAGISPAASTYDDVLKAWGNQYRIEVLPEDTLNSGRVISGKTVLHFPATGLVVAFATTAPLKPGTRVSVAGIEHGSMIATTSGLQVGMSRLDALSIAVTHYRIIEHTTGHTTCRPHNNKETSTDLILHYEKGQIAFIGLYSQ